MKSVWHLKLLSHLLSLSLSVKTVNSLLLGCRGLTLGSTLGTCKKSILGTCNKFAGDLFRYALTGGRGEGAGTAGLVSLVLPRISSIPNFSFCFASFPESCRTGEESLTNWKPFPPPTSILAEWEYLQQYDKWHVTCLYRKEHSHKTRFTLRHYSRK